MKKKPCVLNSYLFLFSKRIFKSFSIITKVVITLMISLLLFSACKKDNNDNKDPNINQDLFLDFNADDTIVLKLGESVEFEIIGADETISSLEWLFPGGNPGESNESNPEIVYDSSGFYSVGLTASNNLGSETKTKENYIKVGSGYFGGWEGVEFPFSDMGELSLCYSGSNIYLSDYGDGGHGTFISTDFGNNWNKICDYTGKTMFVDGNTIVLVSGRIYISYDAGISWQEKYEFSGGPPFGAGDQVSIISWNSVLFVTHRFTGGGGARSQVVRSNDNGQTWSNISQLENKAPMSSCSHGDYLFITTEKGIYRSSNGNSWTLSNSGINGTSFVDLNIIGCNTTLFLTSQWKGTYKSEDFGDSWTLVDPNARMIGHLLFHNNLLYYSNKWISLSKDSGQSWSTINDNLSWPYQYSSNLVVADDFLFVGTNNGIFKRGLSDFIE